MTSIKQATDTFSGVLKELNEIYVPKYLPLQLTINTIFMEVIGQFDFNNSLHFKLEFIMDTIESLFNTSEGAVQEECDKLIEYYITDKNAVINSLIYLVNALAETLKLHIVVNDGFKTTLTACFMYSLKSRSSKLIH